jgi:hypothetical protein
MPAHTPFSAIPHRLKPVPIRRRHASSDGRDSDTRVPGFIIVDQPVREIRPAGKPLAFLAASESRTNRSYGTEPPACHRIHSEFVRETPTSSVDAPHWTDKSDSDPGVSILGVAAFLASSWTWCIGMFLPVLLVRDFGLWAFVVFAVPNCLGAALMGWVMREPGASERFIAAHRRACVWFSRITIAFHAFFLMWTAQREGFASAIAAGLVLNLTINAICLWRRAPDWASSALTYVVSLACAAVMFRAGALSLSPSIADHAAVPAASDTASPIVAALPTTDLLFLAPVCVFGFALCPYLDLSFHLARRRLPAAPGTRAFALGFGLLFLGMIVFTLAYAAILLRADPTFSIAPLPHLAATAGVTAVAALFIHWGSQAAFTMHVHHGMVSRHLHGKAWSMNAAGLAAFLVPMILGLATPWIPAIGPLSGGEALYRAFMAFYGLVFPAYVWICVLPGAWFTRPTRRRILLLAFSVGAAAPMFHMGFIMQQTWWLAPGLAVVLAAGAISRSAWAAK